MLKFYKLFKSARVGGGRVEFVRNVTNLPCVSVSEEVRCALNSGNPVVALESTIITHGMPFPRNVECALEVEEEIKAKGVVPATIAILKGRIKVGLTRDEILTLADPKTEAVKTSRRDVAYVVANQLSGGTTVSATLIIAGKLDIPIFATGGIGGVHRLGEKTFDVSADLTELGRTQVAVVCSGVKSILDVPKTLEYLETQGVFVATYGETKEFPAFYCQKSGQHAPYNVRTPREAACIIHTNRIMNLKSGMVFAVPVPSEHALDEKQMKNAIDEALVLAETRAIRGKEITPFLLARVSEVTAGKSLETNVALVKNNARVAAEIALELSRGTTPKNVESGKAPVVIGGSVLDRCVSVRESDIKLDGRIHDGKCTDSPGGVARNIVDALVKLNQAPVFISAIGDDNAGKFLLSHFPKQVTENVQTLKESTAQCVVIFDSKGECKFLIGDMDAHKQITPELIKSREDLIKNAPIVVMDGNCTVESMGCILEIAARHNVPVFFEPTDVVISRKPFATTHWRAIKYISPNLIELKHIADAIGIHTNVTGGNEIEEAAHIAARLTDYIENVIVTLGPRGLLIARRADASKPLNLTGSVGHLQVRHYPVSEVSNIVNVSGAGDCLTAGLIAAMVEGRSEQNCVSVGIAAAIASLHCTSAVPKVLFSKQHKSWHSNAFYKVLNL